MSGAEAGEPLFEDALVCPVFAALPQEQQLEAFEPAPKGTRKFVLVSKLSASRHCFMKDEPLLVAVPVGFSASSDICTELLL